MEEDAPMSESQQEKLASFMDIVHEPVMRSQQFLKATNWHLEEAIQLYYAETYEDGLGTPLPSSTANLGPKASEPEKISDQGPQKSASQSLNPQLDEYIRPPIPVRRETLYDGQTGSSRLAQSKNAGISVDAFRNFEEESIQHSRRGGETNGKSAATPEGVNDSLAALYRPPFVLMFSGTFEQAKAEAVRQGKWLLINVQSTREFSSYMLNRDTWAHEAVKDTVGMSFIFWQIYDDTEEGQKVCTFYKLSNIPTTLLLDPLTGQKMRGWAGMISAERLLEDLVPYLDQGPVEIMPAGTPPQKRAREEVQDKTTSLSEARDSSLVGNVSASQSTEVSSNADTRQLSTSCPSAIEPRYSTLPDEPGNDAMGSCRVAVRLPDGRRMQRRFLQADPLQYLWLFCRTQLNDTQTARPFRLTRTLPGKTVTLDFTSNMTIEEAGVANSMLLMSWC